MSIELKDPDSNLNSLVDPEQEVLLLRMKLNKDLSTPDTVEVVSPLVQGDGSVNYLSYDSSVDMSMRPKFQVADNRLSLNDKMKSVLVELLENEKVKLNRSLSMTDSDVDEDVPGDGDDSGEGCCPGEDGHDHGNNNKMNTVFIVREKLINDYYDYESEQCQVFENPNASFDDLNVGCGPDDSVKYIEHNSSEEDLLLKEKIINELNVSSVTVQVDEKDDGVGTGIQGEENTSRLEESNVLSTTQSPTTPSQIPVHAATNKSKKKKKNRKK